jgi:protein TonB
MKKIYNLLFLCLLLLANSNLMAQTTKDKIEEPQFPGGRNELLTYMEEHMVHPADMRALGLEGEVVVEFFVERSGVISGVNVVKSLTKSFDDEAIRLTRGMPRWIPGKKNGVPVRYRMTMPINFKVKRHFGKHIDQSK